MRSEKIFKNMIMGMVFMLLATSNVIATCPVCVIAVAGGVELARWLGVDDTISGVWIGGLTLSLAIWLIIWLDKKNIKFKFRDVLIVAFFYATTILSLYWMKFIGSDCVKIWGVDKLLVGIAAGSFVFLIGWIVHNALKKKRGKSYFPYQKVVIPVLCLIIASIIFYLITVC